MENVFPEGGEQFKTTVDDNWATSHFRYECKMMMCVAWWDDINQERWGASGARGRIVQGVRRWMLPYCVPDDSQGKLVLCCVEPNYRGSDVGGIVPTVLRMLCSWNPIKTLPFKEPGTKSPALVSWAPTEELSCPLCLLDCLVNLLRITAEGSAHPLSFTPCV